MIRKKHLILCLTLCTTFSLFSQSRTKAVRGIISDSRSGKRIENVKVYPGHQDDTVYSNSSGRYKIRISSHFRNNIYYEHPDYHPHLEKMKAGSNFYLHRIELTTSSFDFDTICYPTFKGTRRIYGWVFEQKTRTPVINAEIILGDHIRIGYTDTKGLYKLCIPKATTKLMVCHKDYLSGTIIVPKIRHKNPEAVLMIPIRKNPDKVMTETVQKGSDYDFWKKDKNSTRLIINELFGGSVGIDYERFLRLKHSIGLKSSFHIYDGISYGIPFVFSDMGYFKGIKLSPYYRFFFWRNKINGGFLESKISWGYFDFEKMPYHRDASSTDDMYENFSEISNSLGFSVSFGWMMRPQRSPLIMNVSLGLQHFPLNVPKIKHVKVSDQYTLDYIVVDYFWYLGGPGSIIEIKIMIGGIF